MTVEDQYSTEIIEFVQNFYVDNQYRKLITKGIDKATIERLGLDPSQKEFKIKNIVLNYDSFEGKYYTQLIDEGRDLDYVPFEHNKSLIKKLNSIYYDENKSDHITIDELVDLKVCIKGDWTIGNFYLSKVLIGDYYIIRLEDSDRDGYDKYIDDAITYDTVLETLEEYEREMTPALFKSFSNENAFNKHLGEYFNVRYSNVKKSGRSGGIPDLILGNNNEVIIELKLGHSLADKQNLCDSVIGQILRYEDEYFDDSNDRLLYLILIGDEEELLKNQHIQRTRRIVERYKHIFHIIDTHS